MAPLSRSTLPNSTQNASPIKVAFRVRPLNDKDRSLSGGSREVLQVINKDQVVIDGRKTFVYDNVFAPASSQEQVFEECVLPLTDRFLQGYNATVIAYGQSGAGKTYTLGTSPDIIKIEEDAESSRIEGIIPRAVKYIYSCLNSRSASHTEIRYQLTISFIEVFNEELIDLLVPRSASISKLRRISTTWGQISQPTSTQNITIRQDTQGRVFWSGAKEIIVESQSELLRLLLQAVKQRHTEPTDLNSQSSRSHAIFSISLRQQRWIVNDETPLSPSTSVSGTTLHNFVPSANTSPISSYQDPPSDQRAGGDFQILSSKLIFVDLAGSERVRRTSNARTKHKDGIAINAGLLALGNVIHALGGGKSAHVPYRDSKLTRMLQDALGGNSLTLFIACVSPTENDLAETLNTIKYANRGRNIRNFAYQNNEYSSELLFLKEQIGTLKSQLAEYQISGEDNDSELRSQLINLKSRFHSIEAENSLLKQSNDFLRNEMALIGSESYLQIFRSPSVVSDVTDLCYSEPDSVVSNSSFGGSQSGRKSFSSTHNANTILKSSKVTKSPSPATISVTDVSEIAEKNATIEEQAMTIRRLRLEIRETAQAGHEYVKRVHELSQEMQTKESIINQHQKQILELQSHLARANSQEKSLKLRIAELEAHSLQQSSSESQHSQKQNDLYLENNRLITENVRALERIAELEYLLQHTIESPSGKESLDETLGDQSASDLLERDDNLDTRSVISDLRMQLKFSENENRRLNRDLHEAHKMLSSVDQSSALSTLYKKRSIQRISRSSSRISTLNDFDVVVVSSDGDDESSPNEESADFLEAFNPLPEQDEVLMLAEELEALKQDAELAANALEIAKETERERELMEKRITELEANLQTLEHENATLRNLSEKSENIPAVVTRDFSAGEKRLSMAAESSEMVKVDLQKELDECTQTLANEKVKYQKLEKEKLVLVSNVEHLTLENETLSEIHNKLQEDMKIQVNQFGDLNDQFLSTSSNLANVQAAKADLELLAKQQTSEIAKLLAKVDSSKSKLDSEVDRLNAEIKQLVSARETTKSEILAIQQIVSLKSDQLKMAEEEVQKLTLRLSDQERELDAKSKREIDLVNQLSEMKAEVSNLTHEIETLTGISNKYQTEILRARAEIDTLLGTITELKFSTASYESTIAKQESSIKVLETLLEDYQLRLNVKESELKQIAENVLRLEEELKSKSQKLETLESNDVAKERQIKLLDLESIDLKSRVEDLIRENINLRESSEKTLKELEELCVREKSLIEEVNTLKSQRSELTAKVEVHEQDAKTQKVSNGELATTIRTLEESLDSTNKELQLIKSQEVSKLGQIAKLKEELERVNARIRNLMDENETLRSLNSEPALAHDGSLAESRSIPVDSTSEEIKSLSEGLASLEAKYVSVTEEKETLIQELQALRENTTELQQKYFEMQVNVAEADTLRLDLGLARDEIATLKDISSSMEISYRNKVDEFEKLIAQKQEMDSSIDEYAAKDRAVIEGLKEDSTVDSESQKRSNALNHLSDAREELILQQSLLKRIPQLEEDLEIAYQKLEVLYSEFQEEVGRSERLESLNLELEAELSKALAEYENVQKSNSELRSALHSHEVNARSLVDERDLLESDLNEVQAVSDSFESLCIELKSSLRDAYEQLNDLTSERDDLLLKYNQIVADSTNFKSILVREVNLDSKVDDSDLSTVLAGKIAALKARCMQQEAQCDNLLHRINHFSVLYNHSVVSYENVLRLKNDSDSKCRLMEIQLKDALNLVNLLKSDSNQKSITLNAVQRQVAESLRNESEKDSTLKRVMQDYRDLQKLHENLQEKVEGLDKQVVESRSIFVSHNNTIKSLISNIDLEGQNVVNMKNQIGQLNTELQSAAKVRHQLEFEISKLKTSNENLRAELKATQIASEGAVAAIFEGLKEDQIALEGRATSAEERAHSAESRIKDLAIEAEKAALTERELKAQLQNIVDQLNSSTERNRNLEVNLLEVSNSLKHAIVDLDSSKNDNLTFQKTISELKLRSENEAALIMALKIEKDKALEGSQLSYQSLYDSTKKQRDSDFQLISNLREQIEALTLNQKQLLSKELELQAHIDHAQKKHDDLRRELEAAKSQSEALHNATKAQAEADTGLISDLRTRLQFAESKLKQSLDRESALQTEIETTRKARDNLESEFKLIRTELGASLEGLKNERGTLERSVASSELQRAELENSLTGLQSELREIRADRTNLEGLYNATKAQAESDARLILDLRNQLQHAESKLKQTLESEAELQAEKEKIRSSRDNLEAELKAIRTELEASLEGLKNKRGTLERSVASSELQRTELENSLKKLQAELSDLGLTCKNMEKERNELIEKCEILEKRLESAVVAQNEGMEAVGTHDVEITRLRDEIAAIELKLQNEATIKKDLQTTIKNLDEERNDLISKLGMHTEQRSVVDNELVSVKALLEKYKDDIAKLRDIDLKQLNEKLQNEFDAKAKLELLNKALENERNEISARCDLLNKQRSELEMDLDDSKASYQKLQMELTNLRDEELKRSTEKVDTVTSENESLKGKLKRLTALEKELESAKKNVVELKNELAEANKAAENTVMATFEALKEEREDLLNQVKQSNEAKLAAEAELQKIKDSRPAGTRAIDQPTLTDLFTKVDSKSDVTREINENPLKSSKSESSKVRVRAENSKPTAKSERVLTLESELNSSQQLIQELKLKQEELLKDIDQKSKQLTMREQLLESHANEIERQRKNNADLIAELSAIKREKGVVEETLPVGDDVVSQLRRELKLSKAQLNDSIYEIKGLQEWISLLQSENEELKDRLHEMETSGIDELNYPDEKKLLMESKALVEAKDGEIEKLKKVEEKLQQALEEKKGECKTLSKKVKELEQGLEKAKKESSPATRKELSHDFESEEELDQIEAVLKGIKPEELKNPSVRNLSKQLKNAARRIIRDQAYIDRLHEELDKRYSNSISFQMEEQIHELEDTIDSHLEEIEGLQKKLKEHEGLLSKKDDMIMELTDELANLGAKHGTIRPELKTRSRSNNRSGSSSKPRGRIADDLANILPSVLYNDVVPENKIIKEVTNPLSPNSPQPRSASIVRVEQLDILEIHELRTHIEELQAAYLRSKKRIRDLQDYLDDVTCENDLYRDRVSELEIMERAFRKHQIMLSRRPFLAWCVPKRID